VVDKKNSERVVDQALQVKIGQSSRGRGGWSRRGQGRFRGGRNGDKNNVSNSHEHLSTSGYDRKDGTQYRRRGRYGKKKVDTRKIQCYICDKWGHYSYECCQDNGNRKGKKIEEVNLVQEKMGLI